MYFALPSSKYVLQVVPPETWLYLDFQANNDLSQLEIIFESSSPTAEIYLYYLSNELEQIVWK